MRKISIMRKKSFACSLIKYNCIINNGIENNYQIGNGKTIVINTDDKECELSVFSDTVSGTLFSNNITIEAGNGNKNYVIITKYNFIRGPKLIIKEI